MLESVTPFDLIAVTIIIVSAIMAFARGFLRELATLGAFAGAMVAAFFAIYFFQDDLIAALPEDMNPRVVQGVIVVIAFVIVYVIIAWLGQKLSKNIHGADGIGMTDRIAGSAFGIARGAGAMIFFVLVTNILVEQDRIPGYIQDGITYPVFEDLADFVQNKATKVGEDVQAGLPSEAETVQ